MENLTSDRDQSEDSRVHQGLQEGQQGYEGGGGGVMVLRGTGAQLEERIGGERTARVTAEE